MVTKGRVLSHTKILVNRVLEEVYVPNVPAMSISFIFHEYLLVRGLKRCLINWLEWVDFSRCNTCQRESSCKLCDSILQNFCDKIFNFRIIFTLSIFKSFVSSEVFTFGFYCAIP